MSPVNKTKNKPTYWRSLAELEDKPEFREFVEREFATPLEVLPPNSPERRTFLKLMGASFALAGVTSCRWQEDHLLPFSRRPAGEIPGMPRQYATSMDLGGVATGLRVTSYDGRPTKVEGNPLHPGSRGAANVYQQAAILELYDPDRSKGVARYSGGQRRASNWPTFEKFSKQHFEKLRAAGGTGLAVLSLASSSPSVADMKRRFFSAFPQAKWFEYEPLSNDNERAGSQLALGAPHRTHLALEYANVVVSLDSDILGPSHPAGIPNARGLVQGRDPDTGKMNRVYAVESLFTLIGSMADHRLTLRSELIKAVAAWLDAELSQKLSPASELGPAQPFPKAAFLNDAYVKKFLRVMTKDLMANAGRSVVVTGAHQPPEVHALVHRINAVLGNVGQTVSYSEDLEPDRAGHVEALQALTHSMQSGQVNTLLILEGNPAFNAPADVAFGAALAKVGTSVHLALHEDETSRLCTWHLPVAHFLEAWGDARAYDGTISMQQPLIAPLFHGRSWIELLALVSGDKKKHGLDIVKRTHAATLSDPKRWHKAVHDGVVENTRFASVTPAFKPLATFALSPHELGPLAPPDGALEIVFTADAKVYDGRFANNAWLQELADPMTKVAWENTALIAPATAERLGIVDSTLVTLTLNGASVTLPAIQAPGQADGSIKVAVGYGRTTLGHVGGLVDDGVEPVGADVYKLRGSKAMHFTSGLKITPTGKSYRVGCTQHLYAIDQIGKNGEAERVGDIVREATINEYKAKPDFTKEVVDHPPLLALWVPPVTYDTGHKWGMTIDLNRCTGCSACMIACQAENNVPVVGKEQVVMGREMTWIRVDRYYRGDRDNPFVSFQPVPCQQCENAPCEEVCPVGATQHSREGLNEMIYNRCVGTRYCSNNCPYKVRRFNFFNYHMEFKDGKNKMKAMAFNPEVTVRFRGVMEKCSYCIQRIQTVRIKARNARRPIKDGEIKMACQQTCPTDAITFGDLNDASSQVKKLQNDPRAYAMLVHLFTRPRTLYLARIRNPHPELI